MSERGYFPCSGFFTLTYDRDHLPKGGSLCKDDLKKFWKRVRWEIGKSRHTKIKYFACGEYGEKYGRPHYHAIVLGLGESDLEWLTDVWGKGHIHVGNVQAKSIKYVASYMCKKSELTWLGSREEPFQCVSQGMGKRFAEANRENLLKTMRVTFEGQRLTVPRYYIKVFEKGPGSMRGYARRKEEEAKLHISEVLFEKAKQLGIDPLKKWDDNDRRAMYKLLENERRQQAANRKSKMLMKGKGIF